MPEEKRVTTPEIETLRKHQEKKRSYVDPARVLDKAVYQLWETINDLEQLRIPETAIPGPTSPHILGAATMK